MALASCSSEWSTPGGARIDPTASRARSSTLASVDFRSGHWRRAEARSREALRLARMSGSPFDIGSALTTQARIAAARGDEASCRRLLDEARGYAVAGDRVGTYAATGQREADLIEAYVRTAHQREAESLLRDFEERASAGGRAWALAAASRCRGLLGPSEEAEQHLLLALRRHDDVPSSRSRRSSLAA
jgi:ATP/maltotriose-dependent transcriptional regulator MalT